MKIVQVMAGNEEGGLERHFETLCNQLSCYHKVHVIAHEKYADRFNDTVFFHPLDLSKGRRNPLMLYRLYMTIRQINPDIIHAHANKASSMVALLRYFLATGVKRVATLHSQKRNLNAFETFDHVIGVSQRVIAPLKKVKKSVVHNGIDVPEVTYDPDYLHKLGVKEGSFILCAVGRMEKVKHFDMLLHAIKALDVTLLLVGEGSQKASLEALAKQLQIEKKVHFLGFRDDAPNVLYHSDLCVISSEREGFSYVMLESLLLERPIVSTDVGDMRDVLPERYVVPIGDEKALEKVIVSVMAEYGTVLKHYEKYFVFAKKYFRVDVMVQGVLSVYEKVMKQ